jgi:hypothetical protein
MKYEQLTGVGGLSDSNANKLAYLIDNFIGPNGAQFTANATSGNGFVGSSAARSAGLQLAVWKLWYDDGVSLTSFGAGTTQFKVDSASADALADGREVPGAGEYAGRLYEYDRAAPF